MGPRSGPPGWRPVPPVFGRCPARSWVSVMLARALHLPVGEWERWIWAEPPPGKKQGNKVREWLCLPSHDFRSLHDRGAASRVCASPHYSALSVFKERRIVEMRKMQAGILLQCGVSGRCGAAGREGPLSSKDQEPGVLLVLVMWFCSALPRQPEATCARATGV